MLRIILLLFFIYSVSYSFVPYSIPTNYISLLIVIILFFKNKCKLYIPCKSVIALSVIFLFISLVSYTINYPYADLYMVKISFVYLLMVLFLPAYIKTYYGSDPYKILRDIGLVGFINSVFIILMLLSSFAQNLYLSWVSIDTFSLIGGADAIDGLMRLRMIGITGFSAYSTGFVQVSCAFCYLIYMNERQAKNIDYIMWGAILISAMIAARSSIVGIFILLIYFLYASKISIVLRGAIIAVSMGSLTSLLTYNYIPPDLKDFFIQWITEVFTSGTKTGSIQSNIDMYIYGLDDFTLLGDSRWFGNNNDYYMNTDVGWYRVIFSVGLIGCAIWFLLILFFLIEYVQRNKFIELNGVIVISFYIAYIFSIMMKGAILFDSYQSIIFIIVFYMVLGWKKNNEGIKA